MIRRSVRRTFRTVYWKPPADEIPEPAIFVPNHHGWHDGRLMYLALSALRPQGFDTWVRDYDAIPWVGRIGGMPFPGDDPFRRAVTIRKSFRALKDEGRSLLLFAEGELHRPPELLPFAKSLEFLHRKIPTAAIIPVGIRYELSMHERPQAYILFGDPIAPGDHMGRRARLTVAALLDRIAAGILLNPESFEVLQKGEKT
jgi:1-acyl-sn-glycerol-3-phosphate acyltransferase